MFYCFIISMIAFILLLLFLSAICPWLKFITNCNDVSLQFIINFNNEHVAEGKDTKATIEIIKHG